MGNLEMTVSTYPNNDIDLKEEIELIKIALLYSDKVNLKSVKADLFYRVLDYRNQRGFLEKMYYMKGIAHLGKSSLEQEIDSFIRQYKELTNIKLDDRNKGLLKLQVDHEFKKPWGAIEEAIFNLFNMEEIASLEKLIDDDKLNVVRYKTSTTILHENDDYIYEYLKSIEATLSEYNNYPLFDSEISNLVNLGIREGVIRTTSGSRERIKHSNLTLTMLKSLPSFHKANLDEIIDIRSELEKYLTNFRSAIVEYTDLIEKEITDEDLFYEMDKLIMKEINPIIQELDEKCKDNRYLRELGYTLINSKWVQAASLALVLGNIFELFSIAAGTTGAFTSGVEALNFHKKWKDNKSMVEQNKLFFYYQVGIELKKL